MRGSSIEKSRAGKRTLSPFSKPTQTVRLSKSFDKNSIRCEVHDNETLEKYYTNVNATNGSSIENSGAGNRTPSPFSKPTQTIRLSKSFDKISLRCEVHDNATKENNSTCIVVLLIDGANKSTVQRVNNGNISRIISCYTEGEMKVSSLKDNVAKSKSTPPSCRLSISVDASDAKRILALYGKRVVKKVISGSVVGISAIECIGANEAKARGLIGGGNGKMATKRFADEGTVLKNSSNSNSTYGEFDVIATNNLNNYDVEEDSRFKLGGTERRRKLGGRSIGEMPTKTLLSPQPSPELYKHYHASHLEQALNMIGSDILQVNDMFNKTCEINEMKNKEDEPVISLREATEAICRLLKTVPPGAGDIVRHFMEEQEDKRYMSYSDFVKLYGFGFYHIIQARKKTDEDGSSWTMVEKDNDYKTIRKEQYDDGDIIIIDEPVSKNYSAGNYISTIDSDYYDNTTMKTEIIKPKRRSKRATKK